MTLDLRTVRERPANLRLFKEMEALAVEQETECEAHSGVSSKEAAATG